MFSTDDGAFGISLLSIVYRYLVLYMRSPHHRVYYASIVSINSPALAIFPIVLFGIIAITDAYLKMSGIGAYAMTKI